MSKYIIKRILLMIPILIGVSFLVYGITSFMPGDPASIILGSNATGEAIRELNEELGYYDPFLVRYFRWLFDVLQGDFGNSWRTGKPVFTEIFARFPVTLKIATLSMLLSVVIGVSLGVLSAVKQYSVFDYCGTVVSMFLASVPQFWLGLMLLLVFAVELHVLPATGNETWAHFILPTLTLALPAAAKNLRLTRSTMLETIRADYIRTAKAKGVPPSKIVWRHALPNALLPVLTNVGLSFGTLLGGTVVVESVFGMQGVGTLTMSAIRGKDIVQATASIVWLAFLCSVITLIVDIAYAYVDPRIKAKYQS